MVSFWVPHLYYQSTKDTFLLLLRLLDSKQGNSYSCFFHVFGKRDSCIRKKKDYTLSIFWNLLFTRTPAEMFLIWG